MRNVWHIVYENRDLHLISASQTLQYVCAVDQEFSGGIPTATARLRDRGKSSVWYVMDKAALRQIFYEYYTNCFTIIIIYHPGLEQYANKWPQD
jgi:hypothetical protein